MAEAIVHGTEAECDDVVLTGVLMFQSAVKSARLLAFSALLTSCYSLAEMRVPLTVRSQQEAAVLGIWIRAEGPNPSHPELPIPHALGAIVLYPLDVVLSTIVACSAPFDPDIDITWGPIGAVAGIALPGLTLIPYIYPPFHMMRPPRDVDLPLPSFEALITRVKEGDGVRAYLEIVDGPTFGGEDRIISIELINDRHEAMKPAAKPDSTRERTSSSGRPRNARP